MKMSYYDRNATAEECAKLTAEKNRLKAKSGLTEQGEIM